MNNTISQTSLNYFNSSLAKGLTFIPASTESPVGKTILTLKSHPDLVSSTQWTRVSSKSKTTVFRSIRYIYVLFTF